MSIKQISVFVENKPGALYGLTGVLAQNGVDLRALSLAETSEFGIVRIIVDNLYRATTVLKDAGYVHSLTPVVGVAIPDVPGGLNKVLQVLTDARVNVEYMYAFLGGHDVDRAYMIFRVADEGAAEAALAARGIRTLEQEEIEALVRGLRSPQDRSTEQIRAGSCPARIVFMFLEGESFHIRGGGGEKTEHPEAAWTFNISHAYSGVRGETKLPTRLSCFRISFKTPKNIQGPHGLLIQTNLTWESEAKRSFAQGSFASFSFKKRKRACPAPASGGGRSPRGPGCGRSLRLRRG